MVSTKPSKIWFLVVIGKRNPPTVLTRSITLELRKKNRMKKNIGKENMIMVLMPFEEK